MSEPVTGKVDILNTGGGHLTIRLDPDASPVEREKAKNTITDMLKRGYLLFVEKDGQQVKVDSFDPAVNEYILADRPEAHALAAAVEPDTQPAKPGRKPRIKAEKANATAIGPVAGG